MDETRGGCRLAATVLNRKKFIEDNSTPVTESGCWIWEMCIGNDGYGKVSYKGKTYRAHRHSYEVFKDDIPEGLLVCHSCDTPSCVNPEHLFLGTHQDNIGDMVSKNRSDTCGGRKNHPRELVDKIISDSKNLGWGKRKLSKKYGIPMGTISHYIRGTRRKK